jgi:tetratricopeptide (TPR) repeat protein
MRSDRHRHWAIGAAMFAAVAAGCLGQPKPAPADSRQAALVAEQQGKNAEAEADWRAYLKTHPSSGEAYAHLGLLEARQQRYKDAVPLYRKALQIGPDVPGLRLNLGLALFKSEDLKGAVVEFAPLVKRDPENAQLNMLMGLSYYGLAEYTDAVPFLKKAAGRDPKSLPLRLALAHSCLWSKQYQCVMDTYHQILELDPDSAEADMIAGEALDEMKDNEGSTKMFRAAAKANPKEPNVHFGLGYLLWTQKQYPEAASEFEAELANDPNHLQAKLYLGDTHIQLNQMDAAKPLLERVEKDNAAIPLVHIDLGIVYTEAGRNEDALRELKAAEKMAPDDVDVHWRLARLYRTTGKVEEAKAEFDKAKNLNKKVNEDLYKKIADGHKKPAEASDPAAGAGTATAPNQ